MHFRSEGRCGEFDTSSRRPSTSTAHVLWSEEHHEAANWW